MKTEPSQPVDETPSASGPRSGSAEVALAIGLAIMAIIAGRMMYHDSFVDGSTYSNRSFALPGAGFSLLLIVYGCNLW